jgi:hypothetical protein
MPLPLVSLLVLLASTSSFGQDIIVDNLDATTQSGNWHDSAGKNPFGDNSKYSYSGTFTWYPALPKAGNYDVYAWWTYASSRSSNVVYKIELGGFFPFEERVDQRNITFAGRWNRLGTFTYDGVSTAQVSVSANSATVNVNADAVRFVYLSEDETWPFAACPCDGYYNRAIQKYIAGGGELGPQNIDTCAENDNWTISRYITDLSDGTRLRLSLQLDVGESAGSPDANVMCRAVAHYLNNGTVLYERQYNTANFDFELPCRASVRDICKDDVP